MSQTPTRRRHICPDTCRRGGASARALGPWVCGSCGGYREDMNKKDRQEALAFNRENYVDPKLLHFFGMEEIQKPVNIRLLPDGEA